MKNINIYNNDKLSPLTYMILTLYGSRSLFNGIAFTNILETSKYDAWLSSLISVFIGFIFILIMCHINKKDINLFKNSNKFINTFLFIYLSLSFIILLNDFVNFSSIKYLFETSNIFIALIFIIPMLYIANKGIETIGRTGLFMMYISVFIFNASAITLGQYIEVNNIKPILIKGITPVIIGALKESIYMIGPMILINILPKGNENYKKFNKSLIIAYIMSSLSIFTITFYITTIYNYNYISLFNYPVYFLLKKVEYEFISNAENILSFIYILDYFFCLLSYIYLFYYYLKINYNLKEKTNKIVTILITIVFTIISIFGYQKIETVELMKKDSFVIISAVFIIIYLSYGLLKKPKKNS